MKPAAHSRSRVVQSSEVPCQLRKRGGPTTQTPAVRTPRTPAHKDAQAAHRMVKSLTRCAEAGRAAARCADRVRGKAYPRPPKWIDQNGCWFPGRIAPA